MECRYFCLKRTSFDSWICWYIAICHYSRHKLKKTRAKDRRPLKAPDIVGLCVSSEDFVAWIRRRSTPSAWQLLCFSSCSSPLHFTQTWSKVGRGLGKSLKLLISAVWIDTSLPLFQNDSSFNGVCFSVTCCACENLHRFCFLAEALPPTELNYESLADVWKIYY